MYLVYGFRWAHAMYSSMNWNRLVRCLCRLQYTYHINVAWGLQHWLPHVANQCSKTETQLYHVCKYVWHMSCAMCVCNCLLSCRLWSPCVFGMWSVGCAMEVWAKMVVFIVCSFIADALPGCWAPKGWQQLCAHGACCIACILHMGMRIWSIK